MRSTTPLSRSALLAGLLALGSAPALAGGSLAALAYAGGEALAPEHEARLLALTTTPGGVLTRAEVRQQLADAQTGGVLAEAGEIAETPRVLLARSIANERQTRDILAAQEAERARVAAIEAEAEARRLAQEQAQAAQVAALAQAAPAIEDTTAATAAGMTADPSVGVPADADAAPTPVVPGDEPVDRPVERPALAPIEIPITRPSDLPADVEIDKD